MARGDRLVVERGQLVPGAAAADDHDDVEVGAARQRAIARGHHVDGPVALHAHVAHARAGSRVRCGRARAWKSCHAAVPTLVTTPTCSGSGARRRAPVGVEQPAGDQPPHDLVALQGQVAEREPRVETGSSSARAGPTGRRSRGGRRSRTFIPSPRRRRCFCSIGRSRIRGVGEELHVDAPPCRLGGVVGEAEVGVRAALAPTLDLAAHPDAVAEPAAQRRVDRLGQLADRVRRVAPPSSSDSPEVERRLAHAASLHGGGTIVGPSGAELRARCRTSPSSTRSSGSSIGEQLAVDRQIAACGAGRRWLSGRSSCARRVVARSSNDRLSRVEVAASPCRPTRCTCATAGRTCRAAAGSRCWSARSRSCRTPGG